MNALDRFSDKLRNVERAGDKFKASCPVPDHGQRRGDVHPSLNYGVNSDGKVWFACRVGCSDEDVLAAMGLQVADLYERNGHGKNGTRKPSGSWEIRDEAGEVQAVHIRFDHANGDKDCRWKRPNGEWGLDGRPLATLPLYRAELLKDRPKDVPVIVVEGEKPADALATVYPDVVGTVTGAGGTPGPEALALLRDRPIVLWPDNDDPGREHMQRVAEGLAGVAASVRVYEWPEAPGKGDAADHPAVRSGDPATLLAEWAAAPEAELVASRSGHRQEHPGFNLTDLGNAERLVHRHGDGLRYCPQLGGWLAWDGTRWRPDDTGDVERLAKETIRSIYVEAGNESDDAKRKALADHAKRSESRNRIEAMIALARSEPGIPARAEEFDADPWLLNCPNGTVDLRSSTLRLHDRDDLITKVAGTEYDPKAQAPRFERFLKEVLVEDEVIDFVRRFAGYSLAGSTRERVIAILHGRGKNGKSTLIELLQVVMGAYATTTDTETILAKRYQGVGNDVAALKGARFVAAAEVEKGRRLAESKVKQLTGNDTVTARFLYSEPFSFKPEFKLWLSTNNKPEITGTDDAIWDRIRLIPFEQRFDGKAADTELPEKLRGELPGILAWMVRGCGEWLLDGLGEPEKVKAATESYRVEMDVLAAFIEDRCVVKERAVALATPLYEAYRKWCDENGEHPESQKKFGGWLRERGFSDDRERGSRRKIWRGIGLHDPTQPPDTGMFSDSGGGAR